MIRVRCQNGYLSTIYPSIYSRNQIWKRHIHRNCFIWLHEHLITITHWGRVTHICVSNLTIIGSDNGLSPGRRQAIFWTIAGILLIRTLGTDFSEMLREIHKFSFKKMHLKMSSAKWRPFCLGLNVIINDGLRRMLGQSVTVGLYGCWFTIRWNTIQCAFDK